MFAIACASAGTVSGYATADNAFSIYVSTDDTVFGTYYGSGTNWGVSYFINSLPLTAGVTNYLHITGTNSGGPAGFIGTFTLDSALFQFANGTQALNTNTTDWLFSATGFGSGYTTPGDYGANGAGPWGTRSNISASAHWIWDPITSDAAQVYFSTPIAYVGGGTVPEPGTFALIGLGIGAAFLARRRTARQ